MSQKEEYNNKYAISTDDIEFKKPKKIIRCCADESAWYKNHGAPFPYSTQNDEFWKII
jgi:hypothetical protein